MERVLQNRRVLEDFLNQEIEGLLRLVERVERKKPERVRAVEDEALCAANAQE